MIRNLKNTLTTKTAITAKESAKVLSFMFITVGLLACEQQLVKTDVDPENAAQKHIEAGIAYLGKGDSNRAQRHLDKAKAYSTKSADLYHAYALLYRLEGDVDQEEKNYKAALKRDGDSAKVKNNYGSFLCRQKLYKKGLKYLEAASSDYRYLGRADALTNKGACELAKGDVEKAEKSFQQALRLNGQLASPMLELSQIYLDTNRSNFAQSYYKQYLLLKPRQTPRSLWLGIRLARDADDKDAVASYALLLKNKFPNSREYKLYLASIDQ